MEVDSGSGRALASIVRINGGVGFVGRKEKMKGRGRVRDSRPLFKWGVCWGSGVCPAPHACPTNLEQWTPRGVSRPANTKSRGLHSTCFHCLSPSDSSPLSKRRAIFSV